MGIETKPAVSKFEQKVPNDFLRPSIVENQVNRNGCFSSQNIQHLAHGRAAKTWTIRGVHRSRQTQLIPTKSAGRRASRGRKETACKVGTDRGGGRPRDWE